LEKLNKNQNIKKTENKRTIHDKYGDKIEKIIDYDKDKPPHW
tara:strand:- start:218 stop:343 length:126 start_codon:yes stop_codon:yes gene_type:complete